MTGLRRPCWTPKLMIGADLAHCRRSALFSLEAEEPEAVEDLRFR